MVPVRVSPAASSRWRLMVASGGGIRSSAVVPRRTCRASPSLGAAVRRSGDLAVVRSGRVGRSGPVEPARPPRSAARPRRSLGRRPRLAESGRRARPRPTSAIDRLRPDPLTARGRDAARRSRRFVAPSPAAVNDRPCRPAGCHAERAAVDRPAAADDRRSYPPRRTRPQQRPSRPRRPHAPRCRHPTSRTGRPGHRSGRRSFPYEGTSVRRVRARSPGRCAVLPQPTKSQTFTRWMRGVARPRLAEHVQPPRVEYPPGECAVPVPAALAFSHSPGEYVAASGRCWRSDMHRVNTAWPARRTAFMRWINALRAPHPAVEYSPGA